MSVEINSPNLVSNFKSKKYQARLKEGREKESKGERLIDNNIYVSMIAPNYCNYKINMKLILQCNYAIKMNINFNDKYNK